MRILVVLSYYSPHWTGLSQYARRAATGWAAAGHAVSVVCTQHDATLPLHEQQDGVHISRCTVRLTLSRAAVAPSFVATVRARLAATDVVVMHTPLPEAAAVAWVCRQAGVPFVCVHHGDVVYPPKPWVHRGYAALMQWSADWAFRHAAACVTHSPDYADHSTWIAPLRWRFRCITPPVDITPVDTRESARARFGVPHDAVVVGIAGRIVHEKGFDRLFAALPMLQATLPRLHVIHAGAAVPYESVRNALPAAVQRIGLLSESTALAALYQACDVVLVPSRSDCFPSVAIEALRCGTPIIVHDTPGLRDIVRVAGAGRVIDCTDPVALRAAIVHLPPTPDPATMAARFDPQRSADAYLALLQQVVSRHQDVPALVTAHLANEVDMAYRRRARWLVSALALPDARCILDCGCGQGVYVQLLRALTTATVVGVDRDRTRLRQAHPQPVAAADIQALPFAPGTFDRIVLSEVLEHLPDDTATLNALRELLSADGLLAVTVPCARYPFWWDPISVVRAWLRMPPLRAHPWVATIWSNHVRLYTPATLHAALQRAGFEVLELTQQTRATIPFAHFLVYSIGKPLLDRGVLPASWTRYADRRFGSANDGRWWHPFNLLRAVVRACDVRNDRGIDQTGPAVTIVALARPRQAEAPL